MAFGSESEDGGQMVDAQNQEPTLPSFSASGKQPIRKKDKRQNHCTVVGCNASFSRPWRLEAHLSVHCGETPYKCDFEGCTKGYTSKSHLSRHKKTAHTSGFSPSKVYKCPNEGCGAVLKTNQNLNKHLKRAHGDKRVCPECGKKFLKTIHLKYHLQFHTGEFIYQCGDCNIKFARRTEYNRHMRRHRINICPYPGCLLGFVQWSAVRKHLKTHRPRFICYYCNKPFIQKGVFRKHVVRHITNHPKRKSTLKEYECYHCGRNIYGKQSLRRHVKNIHFKKKVTRPVKCNRPRKPRKDKGSSKPAYAFSSELSGVEVARPLAKTLIESYEPLLETADDIIAAIEEALLGTEVDSEHL